MNKDANKLIDEVAQTPTLDEVMRRAKGTVDWKGPSGLDFTEALRADRARFIAKSAARQEKKELDDE